MTAPVEQCFALLAAVDRYPEWCPDAIRDVQVLERTAGDQPQRVRMTIRAAWGALVREFQLLLAVAVDPPRDVTLSRFTDHPTNQTFAAIWQLSPGNSTRITLAFDAALRIPAYVPTAGVATEIAENFVRAAQQRLS